MYVCMYVCVTNDSYSVAGLAVDGGSGQPRHVLRCGGLQQPLQDAAELGPGLTGQHVVRLRLRKQPLGSFSHSY